MTEAGVPGGLFDAHVHIHDPRFGMTVEAVLARASAAGVAGVLAASCGIADWFRLIRSLPERAVAGCQVRLAFGRHPLFDDGQEQMDGRTHDDVRARAAAIGEIGLDRDGPLGMARQRVRFAEMLEMAVALDLPVVVHNRAPWNILLAELDRFPQVRGFVHAFGGSLEIARELQARGFLVSAGTVVLRGDAVRVRAAFAAVPLGMLVVESDAPDMAPPGRPFPNEPALLPLVVEALAGLRGGDPAAVGRACGANLAGLLGEKARGP